MGDFIRSIANALTTIVAQAPRIAALAVTVVNNVAFAVSDAVEASISIVTNATAEVADALDAFANKLDDAFSE